jgi:hypothetical protein
MNTLIVCLWACALLLPTRALTQGRPSPAEIRLELFPTKIVSGVPTGFTFVLTNVSNGDLSIPPPDIDCGNHTPRGTLWLGESWMPATGEGLGKGIGVCDFGGVYPKQKLTLAELTKTWKVLRPGESFRVVVDSDGLHYDTSRSGTYSFSARYSPPQLSPEAELLLSQSRIMIPRQTIATPSQRYAKP